MSYLLPFVLRNRKVSNNHVGLEDLTDEQISEMTWFPRSAVERICTLLHADLSHPTTWSNALPVDTQVLAALQFYATGSFQWMHGRSCGMSQSSVSLTIDSVTQALARYVTAFISFTTDRAAIREQKLAFHAVAGFPNVVGAIDCTHVPIKSPSVNKEAYVNRKGVHTINIQVCDSDMKVNNLSAKWPGSTHDACSDAWTETGISRSVVKSGHGSRLGYLQNIWGSCLLFHLTKLQCLFLATSYWN